MGKLKTGLIKLPFWPNELFDGIKENFENNPIRGKIHG